MKIGVDGFNLGLEKGTGIATYARNLTFALRDIGHETHVLYGTRRPPDTTALMREIAFFDENVGNAPLWLQRLRHLTEVIVHPHSRRAEPVPLTGAVVRRQFASRLPHFDQLWNVAGLYQLAPMHLSWFRKRLAVWLPGGVDVMHWTYPLAIRVRRARNIYTFHDLIPLRLPFTTLDRKRDYFRLCRRLVKRADHIVTVSETSRRDIINLLGAPEEKVTNTWQTVDIPRRYLDVPEDTLTDELAGTFRLERGRYLLFYGSIEPKKNIGRIIEGYLAANLDMPLVIVGAQAWKSEQELRLLVDDNIRSLIQIGSETQVKRRVIRLDYVTFPQLVNLIRGATSIVFPSLYEGFGLPVLEGMLCGTPVITADAHSTKEIAGDAAILVDPYDVRAIKNAILAVTSDAELRASLVAKGREQAKLFSAEKYRERLSEVYGRP